MRRIKDAEVLAVVDTPMVCHFSKKKTPHSDCHASWFLFIDDPPIKRRRNGRISSLEEEVLTFNRELVVYDKSKSCLLVPGEYELGVQTSEGTEKLKLSKVWESFNGKVCNGLLILCVKHVFPAFFFYTGIGTY